MKIRLLYLAPLVTLFAVLVTTVTPLTTSVFAAKVTGSALDRQATRECQNDSEGKKNVLACEFAYKDVYNGGQTSPLRCAMPTSSGTLGAQDPSCAAGMRLGERAAARDGGNNESRARKVCDSNENPGASDRAVAACRKGFDAAKDNKSKTDACEEYDDNETQDACEAGFDAQKSGTSNAVLAAFTTYSGESGNSDDEEDTDTAPACETEFTNPLTWAVCPAVAGINEAVRQLDNIINDLLHIDTGRAFGTESDPSKFKNAWESFRAISIGFIFIVALIIIISSALGFEIFDPYTIRKTLPRLIIAVIFITLSWSILSFLVQLTNDAGDGVRALIYAPFSGQQTELSSLSASIAALLGGIAFLAFGIVGLLSFGLTALLAALIAFLILVLREIIVIFLVIVAPIAIAAMILPNTRKAWDFWRSTLITMLLVFPIISGMIAMGRVFSVITYDASEGNIVNNIISFVAYFLPYFLLPFAFRLAGGVIGTLAGIGNDRTRGAFDRLKNYRQKKSQDNFAAMKAGNRFRSSNPLARGFNRTSRGIANAPSAGMTPWKWKSRYQAGMAQQKMTGIGEYMEKSEAWKAIQGNDDYLQATMKNMGGGDSESDWRRYLHKQGYRGRDLEQGVALIRAAKRDTNDEIFKAAAVTANASTGTGWKTGGAGQMMESINEAAGDDRDLAARILAQTRSAANQAGRIDLGGAGFGGQISDLNAMHAGTMTAQEATERNNKKVLFVKGAQDLSRARGDSMRMIAPAIMEETRAAFQSGNEVTIKRQLAKVANMYDTMSYASPENAEIFADQVLAQPFDGEFQTHEVRLPDGSTRTEFTTDVNGNRVQKTLRSEMERYRSDPEFLNMRKEWNVRDAASGRTAPPEEPGTG